MDLLKAARERVRAAWSAANARRVSQSTARPMSARDAMLHGFGTSALDASQLQRMLRNAQSRLAKDLRATDKLYKNLNDANDPDYSRRRSLSAYHADLVSLRDSMKQYKIRNGQKQVHTWQSRVDAMETYLSGYAGKEKRKAASQGQRVSYLTASEQQFDANVRARNNFIFNRTSNLMGREFASDLQLQDLFDEYEEALHSMDSDYVREVIAKIMARIQDLYETNAGVGGRV